MSQAGSNNIGASPTADVTFITDDGTAIAVTNVINVLGGNGIETYADPDGGDFLFIGMSNTCVGSSQTIGAVTADLCTIALPDTGTYTFTVTISAYTTTGPASAGFNINGVLRSNGVAATVVGDSDGFSHSDASMVDADVNVIASGANAIIRVTGVAGLTINWGSFANYVFRGT